MMILGQRGRSWLSGMGFEVTVAGCSVDKSNNTSKSESRSGSMSKRSRKSRRKSKVQVSL